MPREPNPETKERLVTAAMQLMWQRGFAQTSVDDICREAGVTKGCFFHYFPGKQAISLEAVRRFQQDRSEAFRKADFWQLEDPAARVLGFLDAFRQMASHPEILNGCLIGKMSQELSESDEQMRQLCAECLGAPADHLRVLLEEAKARHCPEAAWSPAELADHCVAVVQGSLLLVRLQRSTQPMLNSLAHLRANVASLLGLGPT